MHPLTLAIFALATGLALRATRLLVDDSITAPLRHYLQAQIYADGKVDADTGAPAPHPGWQFASDLADCPWCFGFWAALAAFGSAYLWGDTATWTWLAAAASGSYLVGLVSMWANSLADD